MKWFKHESTTIKDEIIRNLVDKEGIVAYGIYMVLLELCAEKIDHRLSTTIRSGWPFIEYLTRSRRSTVRRMIATCGALGLLVDESTDYEMVCSVPNLLKRLDNWTSDLVVAKKKLPLESESEREEEERIKNQKNEKPDFFTKEEKSLLLKELSKNGFNHLSHNAEVILNELWAGCRKHKPRNRVAYAITSIQNLKAGK